MGEIGLLDHAASVGVVGKTAIRARAAGLDWESLQKLDDAQLDLRLYGLLHLEYLQAHPNGYKYTQFFERYRRWLKNCRCAGFAPT